MWANAKCLWATIRSNSLAGFVLLSVALGAGIASAQTADPNEGRIAPAPVMGEEEQAIILEAIEEYFDSVSTLQARFRQLNMDGSIFTGDIGDQRI